MNWTAHRDEKYYFVMADATYVKVRENHKVVAKALLIAMGLTAGGMKEISFGRR